MNDAMKPLNVYFLFLLFSSFSLPGKAQLDTVKYDKTCFLMGTLDEYMGYCRSFKVKGEDEFHQRIDRYGLQQLPTALFLNSLFEPDYQDIYLVKSGDNPPVLTMYSSRLSSEVDKYYEYKPEMGISRQGNRLWKGRMKKEKLETEKQKLSYLLGAYLIYRRECAEDGRYCFYLANAGDKAILIKELLQGLGCRKIDYDILQNIPRGNVLTFEPSFKMQQVIDEAERLQAYISGIDTKKVEFTADGKKYLLKEFPQMSVEESVKVMKKMMNKK